MKAAHTSIYPKQKLVPLRVFICVDAALIKIIKKVTKMESLALRTKRVCRNPYKNIYILHNIISYFLCNLILTYDTFFVEGTGHRSGIIFWNNNCNLNLIYYLTVFLTLKKFFKTCLIKFDETDLSKWLYNN